MLYRQLLPLANCQERCRMQPQNQNRQLIELIQFETVQRELNKKHAPKEVEPKLPYEGPQVKLTPEQKAIRMKVEAISRNKKKKARKQ